MRTALPVPQQSLARGLGLFPGAAVCGRVVSARQAGSPGVVQAEMRVGRLPTVSETAPGTEQPAEQRGKATGELGGSEREKVPGTGLSFCKSRKFRDKELPGRTAGPGHVRNIKQTQLTR